MRTKILDWKFFREGICIMLYMICKILLWIPLMLLHPTSIKGKKNLPKGKAILSLNHRSNWDYVMFGVNSTTKYRVLAKKELFHNKLFGAVLRNFGAIEIDREANDINAIKQCMKVLKEDKKLLVFPEGTRLKDESQLLGEIKSGMALIAIKTKTPIVPVWIVKKIRFFRRSVYVIGKPFELSEFYGIKLDEETLEKANQVVREKMLEVRQDWIDRKTKKRK